MSYLKDLNECATTLFVYLSDVIVSRSTGLVCTQCVHLQVLILQWQWRNDPS